MQLVHFKEIESSGLCAQTVQVTREEKTAEITHHIVYSSKVTEPIAVTYLSTSESELDAENSDSDTISKASGTAVRLDTNKWHVILTNNTSITATDEDLLDPNNFYVECKWMRVENDETSKKKQLQSKRGHVRVNKKRKKKGFLKKGLKIA